MSALATPAYISFFIGALPQIKSGTSVKYPFPEMKGDLIGMLRHEKKGNKKIPIPKQEVIITPSLHHRFELKFLYT